MEKKKKGDVLLKYTTAGPISFWVVFFIGIPLLYIVAMCFMTRGEYGGVELGFTLENIGQVFDPLYLKIFGRSLLLAAVTTILCLLLAYPFVYYVAQKGKVARTVLMSLVLVPFVVSSLIRLFALVNLLRKDGILNTLLINWGLINEPLQLVYNITGVLIGLVYTLLPFMIMPLYSSVEKLDPSLLQASEDLGSRSIHSFFTITLPLTTPGIFGGVLMTFIPTLGLFFVTDVMGGGKIQVVGNIIRDQFMTAHNWPVGAGLSILLILLTLLLVWIYRAAGGKMDELA